MVFPSIYLNKGGGMGKIRKHAGADHFLKQIYTSMRSLFDHALMFHMSNQVPVPGIFHQW